MPFSDMVERIKQKSGLSEEEINAKIEQKCNTLAGLVSKEGAAYIIANELGIKLVENSGKIKSMYPGMRNVEVAGRVTQVFEPKDFVRADESAGRVGSFVLADDTGTIRVVCWGDQVKNMENLAVNNVVKVSNGVVRQNMRGYKEIHLSQGSSLVINPPGVEVSEVVAMAQRKSIKDLTENDQQVEILGTVVQLLDPKFFEVCPQCNTRLKELEGNWVCGQHNVVMPAYAYLLNLYLDDGTENIRVVLFRNQAERLLSKTQEEILAYREKPETFEPIKTQFLGEQFKFVGRARHNTFFDAIEFIATQVFPVKGEEEQKQEPKGEPS